MKKSLIMNCKQYASYCILLFSVFFISTSCSVKFYRGETSHDKLEKLAEWMTGSFTSEEQSILDTSFYNIHLQMVRIWPDRKDGIWLYVEQAASWALEKPYRQRVYHLTQEVCGSTYKSAVYTFEDPLRFAGDYAVSEPLAGLTVDSLEEKTGCHIVLEYDDCEFTGSTGVKTCDSELRGASYATSEVSLTKYALKSWDRGFDETGKQVWGATKGPYIFKKVN